MNKLSPTQTTPALQAKFLPHYSNHIQHWNNALESGHTGKMIKLILSVKTFTFYERRNKKKTKEVNKTEPREIQKKKFAGFYNEVNPVLAAFLWDDPDQGQ